MIRVVWSKLVERRRDLSVEQQQDDTTLVVFSKYLLSKNMKLYLIPLLILKLCQISYTYEVKSGRLFSNPFGLLGHEACLSTIEDRNVTGLCYNEMECLLK